MGDIKLELADVTPVAIRLELTVGTGATTIQYINNEILNKRVSVEPQTLTAAQRAQARENLKIELPTVNKNLLPSPETGIGWSENPNVGAHSVIDINGIDWMNLEAQTDDCWFWLPIGVAEPNKDYTLSFDLIGTTPIKINFSYQFEQEYTAASDKIPLRVTKTFKWNGEPNHRVVYFRISTNGWSNRVRNFKLEEGTIETRIATIKDVTAETIARQTADEALHTWIGNVENAVTAETIARQTAITNAINALKAEAPEAYDTLIEIASKLSEDDGVIAGLLSAINLRVTTAQFAAASNSLQTQINGRLELIEIPYLADTSTYLDNINLEEGIHNYGHGSVLCVEHRDSVTFDRDGLYQFLFSSGGIMHRRINLVAEGEQTYPAWIQPYTGDDAVKNSTSNTFYMSGTDWTDLVMSLSVEGNYIFIDEDDSDGRPAILPSVGQGQTFQYNCSLVGVNYAGMGNRTLKMHLIGTNRNFTWDIDANHIVEDVKLKTINGDSILGDGNIEISGGSPDAILFTFQDLTTEQKTQARANIDIDKIVGFQKDGGSEDYVQYYGASYNQMLDFEYGGTYLYDNAGNLTLKGEDGAVTFGSSLGNSPLNRFFSNGSQVLMQQGEGNYIQVQDGSFNIVSGGELIFNYDPDYRGLELNNGNSYISVNGDVGIVAEPNGGYVNLEADIINISAISGLSMFAAGTVTFESLGNDGSDYSAQLNSDGFTISDLTNYSNRGISLRAGDNPSMSVYDEDRILGLSLAYGLPQLTSSAELSISSWGTLEVGSQDTRSTTIIQGTDFWGSANSQIILGYNSNRDQSGISLESSGIVSIDGAADNGYIGIGQSMMYSNIFIGSEYGVVRIPLGDMHALTFSDNTLTRTSYLFDDKPIITFGGEGEVYLNANGMITDGLNTNSIYAPTETATTSTNANKVYIMKPDGKLAVMSKANFKTWLNN